MISLPFDVNENQIRKEFLQKNLEEVIRGLKENDEAAWGKMNAQQMIEHLIWAIDLSIGEVKVSCSTPKEKIPIYKTFLWNHTPTRQNFKNPVLGETLPALEFLSLSKAREGLIKKVNDFYSYYHKYPNALEIHPIFGLLNFEEWERNHYKHCFHHLKQFGLIKEKPSQD